MHSAIVVFPGSNCVAEMERFLRLYFKQTPAMIWHKDTKVPEADLYVLPGGFSYGDYLRAGALASISPVMNEIKKKVKKGNKVLGICNGFQILCETKLLPGTLRINDNKTKGPKMPIGTIYRNFICKSVLLEPHDYLMPSVLLEPHDFLIPIAHGEGNYYHSKPKSVNVAFTYKDNPNGSVNDIAGIFNKKGNVLGMMPHPERAFEDYHCSQDGYKVLDMFIQ